ncbi:hypothetical protein HPTD01_3419 [Halomonas sp. TD01]|nr:hypothetical protein HPTD01_3419 [Halomonas sp. TD01]
MPQNKKSQHYAGNAITDDVRRLYDNNDEFAKVSIDVTQ